ncbi:MAG TPA: histidinol dehydrogenase [Chthoniobacterales bacterium]|jgi:histidinol dehydrogenase
MKILRHTDPEFARETAKLNRFAAPSPAVRQTVSEIVENVGKNGDSALLEYTAKFGGPTLEAAQIRVTQNEWESAKVDAATQEVLTLCHSNVAEFAKRSLRQNWSMHNAQGVLVGERFDPFQRVGIYVPGGTAPLVSTALMTVTLAAVAGVPEIVVTTPAGADGTINPALLVALRMAGATEIYGVGGAQAIAALAFGTDTIKPVLKIFGPGNSYVIEAKRQVFGKVAIDQLPGPSEILILADETANPAWIGADLLAQAEHGHDSVIGLLTDSEAVLSAVCTEIEKQAATLSRQSYLLEVLEKNAFLILCADLDQGVSLANQFSSEHLTIVTRNPEKLSLQIHTAGAIFLGPWSPVAGGDYLAGPSHTLPTGGAGKSFAGLTVDQFQRRTSVVEFHENSLHTSAPIIAAAAALEGLDAHARSATIRLPHHS